MSEAEVRTLQYFLSGIFRDKDGQCEIKSVVFNGVASTANQIAIAAVTGKRIRVISGNMFSAGIASDVYIASPSGTAVGGAQIPANTVATPNVELEFNPAGHYESAVGEALRVSVAAAVIVVFFFRYIEYTP